MKANFAQQGFQLWSRWDDSIDMSSSGVFISNTNSKCSVAKVRKTKLNICNEQIEFNLFLDHARVPNYVKGLCNVKKKGPYMLGVVKCIVNLRT